MARGQVFGNLYLTEKRGPAGFDADDEQALVILAAQAGVAVEKARLYEELEARVQRRLDSLQAISTAIVGGHDADEVTGTMVVVLTWGRLGVWGGGLGTCGRGRRGWVGGRRW